MTDHCFAFAKKVWTVEIARYNENVDESLNNLVLAMHVVDKHEGHVDECFLKSVHACIMGSQDPCGGLYRKTNVQPYGGGTVYLPHFAIQENITMTLKALNTFEENESLKQTFMRVTIFFSSFLKIHPFLDGNGRTARLIAAKVLYPYLKKYITPCEDWDTYLFNLYTSQSRRELSRYNNLCRMFEVHEDG